MGTLLLRPRPMVIARRTKSGFGKHNPFPAKLLRNVCLNKPGSGKEVRHYEISLEGSGLSYEAGDALGVVPVRLPRTGRRHYSKHFGPTAVSQ